MKTMLLAAAAALSLGIGSAYADSEGGQFRITQFTEIPGVLAQLRRRTPRPSRPRRTDRRCLRGALGFCHPTWIGVGAQSIDLIASRDNSVSWHMIYAKSVAKLVTWLIAEASLSVGEMASRVAVYVVAWRSSIRAASTGMPSPRWPPGS